MMNVYVLIKFKVTIDSYLDFQLHVLFRRTTEGILGWLLLVLAMQLYPI